MSKMQSDECVDKGGHQPRIKQRTACGNILLIPVFNDWVSVRHLLQEVNQKLHEANLTASVVIVDDCSDQPFCSDGDSEPFSHIEQVVVARLNCNLGHQRAIATGLSYIYRHYRPEIVVVLDGDGEDKPEDVLHLLRALQQIEVDVVFAERRRRSESHIFQMGYILYRMIHFLLVGHRIRFGNFSAIRGAALEKIVRDGLLWNHYAAAVVHSSLSYTTVPTDRGVRYDGRSTFGIAGLVSHGLNALGVFYETIIARLLIILLILHSGLLVAVVNVLLFIRPVWPALCAICFISLLSMTAVSVTLCVLTIVSFRSFPSFIPCRDSAHFIDEETPR